MRTATPTFDASILPEQARQELFDFYSFLVSKYAKRKVRTSEESVSTTGTAGSLAASPLIGIWKNREIGDSATFARSLRSQAQKRTLS